MSPNASVEFWLLREPTCRSILVVDNTGCATGRRDGHARESPQHGARCRAVIHFHLRLGADEKLNENERSHGVERSIKSYISELPAC